MTVVRVKGIKKFRSKKNGKVYCYHRVTGRRIDAEFGTGAFFAELARLDALAAEVEPNPGTLGGLFVEWRARPDVGEHSPRYRADCAGVLDYLQPLEAMPLADLDRAFIVRLRDKTYKKRKRRFANYVVAVHSSISSWGVDQGLLADNPCRGVRPIKRPKDLPRANRPWTDQERSIVLEAAPPHVKVPLALCMFAGLREGDAITITKSAYDGAAIGKRTNKSGQTIWWPCPAPLRTILAAAPKHDAVTIAANSRGRPWTGNGFRAVVFKMIRTLQVEGRVGPGLTIHGLRHTVAKILREIGYDNETIADALGQSSPGMAMHYAKEADLRKKMTGVVRRFDRRMNKVATKAVKPTE
jgi:integrase